MTTTVANLLLLLAGAPLLLLVLGKQAHGPEGPVGFHLVTLPLALGLTAACALAAGHGRLASLGLPTWVAWLAVPGFLVAMTVLPILAADADWRLFARLATVCTVLTIACWLNLPGRTPPSISVQWTLIGYLLAVSFCGYSLLATWLWAQQRNHLVAAQQQIADQNAFELRQAEWQRSEWSKLPTNPELWRLIQFSQAFAADVRHECHARIASLPELDEQMSSLLATGWASQALRYIADHYPHSRAGLAPAYAKLLQRELPKWRRTLDEAEQPWTYFGNLASLLQAAAAIAADGGDLRREAAAWAAMLQNRPGLAPLRELARSTVGSPF